MDPPVPPPIPDFAPPPPDERGAVALDWLRAHGIIPIIPPIRASDEQFLGCPFLYYLTRRLGIISGLRYSKALNRGSWMHRCLFHHNNPDMRGAIMSELSVRLSELRASCEHFGITGERRDTILRIEEQDATSALAWYEVASNLPIPNNTITNGFSFRSYFNAVGTWHGQEDTLTFKDNNHPVPLVFQPDTFILSKKAPYLYLLDLKSCDEAPSLRMERCLLSFQTRHYLYITQQMLDAGILQSRYGWPSDTTLKGMIHVVIQKPTINFCDKDRDFTEETRPLKSGPRKGQLVTERTYFGEPKYANYLRRCADWYKGTGLYSDSAAERVTSPPVALSFTPVEKALDEGLLFEYHAILSSLCDLARRTPYPNLFPRTDSGMTTYGGKITELAPLFVAPVSAWPDIITENNLIIAHRDGEIPPHPSTSHIASGDPQ